MRGAVGGAAPCRGRGSRPLLGARGLFLFRFGVWARRPLPAALSGVEAPGGEARGQSRRDFALTPEPSGREGQGRPHRNRKRAAQGERVPAPPPAWRMRSASAPPLLPEPSPNRLSGKRFGGRQGGGVRRAAWGGRPRTGTARGGQPGRPRAPGPGTAGRHGVPAGAAGAAAGLPPARPLPGPRVTHAGR